MDRPISVSIVAWLLVLFSVLGIISYVSMHDNIMSHLSDANIGSHFYYLGLITSIIDLICGVFFLLRGNWARFLFLCWNIIMLVYSYTVVAGPFLSPIIVRTAVFIVFVIFLFTPSAMAYFAKRN